MGADLLLGKLDLMQEGLVLVVGFDRKRLVTILRYFQLLVLNCISLSATRKIMAMKDTKVPDMTIKVIGY